MNTGSGSALRPIDNPYALVRVVLWGPRGGWIGSADLDVDEARQLHGDLDKILREYEATRQLVEAESDH